MSVHRASPAHGKMCALPKKLSKARRLRLSRKGNFDSFRRMLPVVRQWPKEKKLTERKPNAPQYSRSMQRDRRSAGTRQPYRAKLRRLLAGASKRATSTREAHRE